MTQPTRILSVDDEPQIHRYLRPSLAASGFDVIVASSGAEALRHVPTNSICVVILDLGLPDMDGKDVLSETRRRSDVPVIVLSARDREGEKITALDLGADDYVNKPFAIGELLARIRSVLRRKMITAPQEPNQYHLGPLLIDTALHQVTRGGQIIRLTPKEFDLLVVLARHAGRVVTHQQILTEVWGPAHGADTRYLRVFICQLRQKIEDAPTEPTLILTEPGIGYRVREQD
jgi:two-component system, OmpR family, KDP operon response regulator KdpE